MFKTLATGERDGLNSDQGRCVYSQGAERGASGWGVTRGDFRGRGCLLKRVGREAKPTSKVAVKVSRGGVLPAAQQRASPPGHPSGTGGYPSRARPAPQPAQEVAHGAFSESTFESLT